MDAARTSIEACEAELAGATGTRRAARLHFEAARLYEFPLDDLRRAAAHYDQALLKAPEHLPTLRGARRVSVARKSYGKALPLFDAEARLTPNAKQKAALFLAKGRLLEDTLGKRDEARAAYATALELDRANASILRALEQRFVDVGAPQELDRILEQTANAVADDPRTRAALIVRRAQLAEARSETDRAVELYETALKLDERAGSAVAALCRLHHEKKRWRDLIRVLALSAQQTTDPALRAAAQYRVGRLHGDRLGNQDEAITALESAVEDAPHDALILAELARLYEVASRPDALVRVLERLTESTREAQERLALLHRIGQLYEEQLESATAAVHWYEAALKVAPTNVPTLRALGSLYSRQGRWDDLIKMLSSEAESATDPRRRADAHARVGALFEEHLGEPDEAAKHHARALAALPGHHASFKALTRLHAAAGRHRELIELYGRAVDLAPNHALAVAYLFKIGSVYEDALGDHGQAAHSYRRILSLDGDDLGAIHALQRATERAGRYAELVEALELEADKTTEIEQIVALLHRAGEVLADRVGDKSGAIERFRRVIELHRDNRPALASLGRLYHAAGRWEDLLDIYRRELELTPRGPESVALLQKMGDLCRERIGRDDDALDHYRRALDVDPTHGPALRALTRKLRERGAWADLVRVLEVELSGLADPIARANAAYRLGEVLEEHIDEPEDERAILAYEQAVQCVPEHRPAGDALARLRARQEQWQTLATELERDARAATDESRTVELLLAQGTLFEAKLSTPRRAIACYEEILALAPDHIGALMALEPLYRKVGAWSELAQVFDAQARVQTGAGAKVAALRELARIQRDKAGQQTAEVAHTLHRLLELAPDDLSATLGLEDAAIAGRDRELLEKVDETIACSDAAVSLRAAHQVRLAESYEATDLRGALEAHRVALDLDAECIGAVRGLSRVAVALDDPHALAEAGRREASVTPNPEAAAELLVRSASVRTDRLGDLGGAQADLERALEKWPDSTAAAQNLSVLLSTSGRAARLADLLARAAGSARSPQRVAALWMEVARIQAETLGNLAGAVGSLGRVLRTAPNHVPTLSELARLHVAGGHYSEAAEVLGRVVQLAPAGDVLRNAHLELGEIMDRQLGDDTRALVSLQAVLAIDPENRRALDHLSDLYARQGRHEQAAEIAQRLLAVSGGFQDRATALLRIAHTADQLDDGARAADALRQAVTIQGPGSEPALDLKSRNESPADWSLYVEAVRGYVASNLHKGRPAPSYLEISRVLCDHLGDAETGIETLTTGLAASDGDPALRRELAARLKQLGRYDEAIEELAKLVDADVTVAAPWRELARAYAEVNRPAEARIASMPLALLGAANAQELGALGASPPQPSTAARGSLGVEILDRLESPNKAGQAAAELLRILEVGLAKLYPPDFDGYGLSSRDKMTTKGGQPVRLLADRIAAILGIESFDLFVHRMRTGGVSVELGSTPAILVPQALTELPETQQVFLLARPLANLARGFQALDKLTPRELEVLLASASRMVQPGFGSGLTSEDVLDQQQKRIHKAIGRRARKSAEEAARNYVAAGPVDFPRFCRAALRTTNRVALLIADDLMGAAQALGALEGDGPAPIGPELVGRSDAMKDMLKFWASDAALHLRRHTGMIKPAV